jgi:beta-phosphoglucomutase-like phosphatase (HAD superfamily)
MPHAIIFDLEGVVIDSERFWTQALEQWFEGLGLSYDDTKVKSKASGHSVYEGTAIIMDSFGIIGDRYAQARERIESMKILLKEIEFIPGFERFYDQVKGAYKTAVGSSIDKELLEVVDARLGIIGLFNNQVYTVADAGGKGKPDPAIFLYAASRIRSEPKDCIVIEDSPLGIDAARSAGMKCIGLATTYPASVLEDADMVFRAYSEIDLQMLRKM